MINYFFLSFKMSENQLKLQKQSFANIEKHKFTDEQVQEINQISQKMTKSKRELFGSIISLSPTLNTVIQQQIQQLKVPSLVKLSEEESQLSEAAKKVAQAVKKMEVSADIDPEITGKTPTTFGGVNSDFNEYI